VIDIQFNEGQMHCIVPYATGIY